MKKHLFAVTVITVFLFACKKGDDPSPSPPTPPQNENIFTGWSGNDDVSNVPSSLNFSFGGTSLASSVDLTPYLPPIGDQGQYGTCVAWATAYYTKTASEAIIHNYNSSQLQSPSYQLSPKYLFLSIANDQKSPNCNGTDFVPALENLQQKGVATLATVPYYNLYDCNSSLVEPSWNSDADHHRIKYYRKIDYSVESIKQQLANKFPVIIGARLPDNFLNWSGSGVLSASSSYTHGNVLHALTIVGYDDARQAFRIANSWGRSWGDNGFIWIDYNYLLSNFVFNNNLYIISSDEGDVTPPPNPVNNGVDIATWVFSDISTFQQTGNSNSRSITFNLYNIGSTAAEPSANWTFYYLYYNAYNANDYGILFQDQFTTSVPANTINCVSDYNCNINYRIPAGSNFAQVAFNQTSLFRGYIVPPLNGFYYLVLVADAGGAFNEQNEQNNIFYTTGQLPKFFQNGLAPVQTRDQEDKFVNENLPTKDKLKKSEFNSAVNSKNRNAYTPQEIISFVKHKVKTGEMKRKLDSLKRTPTPKFPFLYEK